MSADNPGLSRPILSAPAAQRRPSLLLRLGSAVLRWQDRARERQQLAAMDPRMLRDMGMTPDDVSRELGKLHWRR